MRHLSAFLCIVLLFAATSSLVQANWLGPYDTHDDYSLWLRKQMEKPPRVSFILQNENDGFNIMNYGAVPFENSIAVSIANGQALFNAVLAANASRNVPRVVVIPAGYSFWMIPTMPGFNNLQNITFQFNGNLSCNPNNFTAWPMDMQTNNHGKLPLFFFTGGKDITMVGNGGSIQGHGYKWWVEEFTNSSYGAKRPNLIQFQETEYVVVDSLTLYDSPRYHLYMCPGYGVLIQHVKVEVSIFDQYELQKKHGKMLHDGIDFPTFPLNTDGIDLHGNTIVVRWCHVENFDDSYCPKPLDQNSRKGSTRNILVENSSIHFGVGASCGSVPPSSGIATIENVTFNRINWKNCLKCVYIKPNPGNSGYGLIRDVTYKNSYGETPLWWSVFISTQQQDQPGGGSNTGCSFLYPLPGYHCPTQPRVPVQNLILQNMTFEAPLLSPGIMRCNDTFEGVHSGPCTGWKWTDVSAPNSILKWPFGENFLCHALVDPQFTNVYPSCVGSMPPASPPALHNHEFLQSLFREDRHYDKNSHTDEAKKMLDELAMLMEKGGHSLMNSMKKLHGKK